MSPTGPGDNFYAYINKETLEQFKIPDDKSQYTWFHKLADQAQISLKEIIGDVDNKMITDFKNSYNNYDLRNKLGIEPIQHIFDEIDNTTDVTSLFLLMSKYSIVNPIEIDIGVNNKNPQRYITFFGQGSLFMPDRDYYMDDKFSDKCNECKKYIDILCKYIVKDFDAISDKIISDEIISLETKLAKIQMSRVDLRDCENTYNLYKVEDLISLNSNINWSVFITNLRSESGALTNLRSESGALTNLRSESGALTNLRSESGALTNLRSESSEIKDLVVKTPEYFKELDILLTTVPLSIWKLYQKIHTLNEFAEYLTQELELQKFNFYGHILNGQICQKEQWKRTLDLISLYVPDTLGSIYIQKHFNAVSKIKIDKYIENVKESFRSSILELEWMSEKTKKSALKKLDSFYPKIGFPSKWKTYEYETDENKLVQSIINGLEYNRSYNINKLSKEVDREEWFMNPYEVNAYYNPSLNEIVFPAAILQRPFFDPNEDDAYNYGGICGVIGHEMGHAFDDQGSKYDYLGRMNDWYTKEDRELYKNITDNLIEQYSQYELFPDKIGYKVNGSLTVGENIGDLGGLTIALKALKMHMGSNLTKEHLQKFFSNWANIWTSNIREECAIQRLVTDPHSPPIYRVNGVLSNMDDFYDSFDIVETDKMYIKKEKRIKVW